MPPHRPGNLSGNIARFTLATSLLAFVWLVPPASAQPTPSSSRPPGRPVIPIETRSPDIIDVRSLHRGIDGRRPVAPFFPPPDEWGSPVDDVAMSLRLDKESYRPGESVFATINLKNRGANAYTVRSVGNADRYEVVCLTADGEPAPQNPDAAFRQVHWRTRSLPLGGPQGGGHHFDRIELSRYVDLAKPGRYSVRIKTPYFARIQEQEAERVVTSNAVNFEISEGGNDPTAEEGRNYPTSRGIATAGNPPTPVAPLPVLTPQTNRYPAGRYPSTRTARVLTDESNNSVKAEPPDVGSGRFDAFGREIPHVSSAVDPVTGRPVGRDGDPADAVIPRSEIVFKGELIGSFFDAGIVPFSESRPHLWGRPDAGVSVALAMDKNSYQLGEPLTAIVHLKNDSNHDHSLPDIPPEAMFSFWAARNTAKIETPSSASVEQPTEPSPTDRLPFGGQQRETGRYAYGIQLQDFFDATQPGQYIVELRTRYLPADGGPAREVVSGRTVFSVYQPRSIPSRSTRP